MTSQQAALYGGSIPQTDIWNPARGSNSAVMEPLQVGVNTMCENYADLSQFGPEASLMASLQNQSRRKRIVFKQGQGGTTLAVEWRPPTPSEFLWQSGVRWQQFVSWLTMAVSQAATKGYKLDLRAIIWMQGEDDAKTLPHANAYLSNMNGFFAAINNMWQGFTNTYGLPTTPYKKIIGRIYAPNAYPFREIVRTAEEQFCALPSNNAVLINTDSYPLQDWVHYNATGQIQFGLDIFNAAVLEPAATLAVTLSSFKAYRQGSEAVIEWKSENEEGVKGYEVERSVDGKNFRTIAVKLPTGNGTSVAAYKHHDVNPLGADNFYRIRSLDRNGSESYTQVLQVSFAKSRGGYEVYPNPITGNHINLLMVNKPKGTYYVQLINTSGHIIISKQVSFNGGSGAVPIELYRDLQKGNYVLQVTGTDNKVQSFKLMY
jgi:hypothetical protein